jgi:mono/diheme cytochrome c family protein
MTLVIQSGIKGDMPSFAKKYSDADIQKIVAYLQTLK